MAGSSGFSLVSEIAQFVFNAIALEAVYLLAVEILQLLAYIISSNQNTEGTYSFFSFNKTSFSEITEMAFNFLN